MNNLEHMDPGVLKEALVRAAAEYRTANRCDDQHIITSVVPDQYHMILSDNDISEMLADYSVEVWSHTEFYGDRRE